MKSIPLLALALLIVGGTGRAQSASDGPKGLDACVEAAHAADDACSRITSDPVQRLSCIKKAGAEQLDCLERALTAATGGTAAVENGPAAAAAPAPPPA